MENLESLSAVPTNIITGFLGVGKTTAILDLLKRKPANARWAVLVNEFGEVGVDGSLFKGRQSEEQRVFIREVPGGCMCCTAGLPMQIALNQLLSHAMPDRLLIEPTGLGHPKEILEILSSDFYQNVLSLRTILTLVDARKLADSRYTNHETFNQQIEIADVVVGNKEDLYEASDRETLQRYVATHAPADARIVLTQQGVIPLELLEGESRFSVKKICASSSHASHEHDDRNANTVAETDYNEMAQSSDGIVRKVNQGEGYTSMGWRISPEHVFQHDRLYSVLSGIKAERMKAVFITDQGVYGYNLTSDTMTEMALDDCSESRIEIIALSIDQDLEQALMACVMG